MRQNQNLSLYYMEQVSRWHLHAWDTCVKRPEEWGLTALPAAAQGWTASLTFQMWELHGLEHMLPVDSSDHVLVCVRLRKFLRWENFSVKPWKSWTNQNVLTTLLWNKRLTLVINPNGKVGIWVKNYSSQGNILMELFKLLSNMSSGKDTAWKFRGLFSPLPLLLTYSGTLENLLYHP